MARLFARASSQGLQKSVSLASNPYTMSCWVKPTTVATVQTAMGISIATAAARYDVMGITASAKPFLEGGTSTATDSLHATSAVAGTWGHLCGVASSASNRLIYWNGVAGTADTNTQALATMNRFGVGMLVRDVNSSFFDGSIAECALWNVALTTAEITMLSLGVSPLFVRPSALVYYVPILGTVGSEPELFGQALAATNAPVAAPHVAIRRPRPSLIIPHRATVGSPQTQIVTGRVSSSAFGTVAAVAGGVSKAVAGLASESAFGSVVPLPGGVSTPVSGLASEASLGAVTPSSSVRVAPAGLASEAAFSTLTAVPKITKPVAGLASEAAFGSVAPRPGGVSTPVSGLASEASFGAVTVSGAAPSVSVAGLASEAVFGAASVRAIRTLAVAGLSSEASFGVVLTRAAVVKTVAGLVSESAFGNVTPAVGGVARAVSGLASESLAGSVVTRGAILVPVSGRGSSSAFASVSASSGPVTVPVPGLPSEARFGAQTILGGSAVAAVQQRIKFGGPQFRLRL